VRRRREPQISPLRCAPVEMTIHFEDKIPFSRRIYKNILATELSSRPERTRISCFAAPDRTTCAAFIEESRMKFAGATNPDRKSGVAEWRDLRFSVIS
jgi:hypothetical protein